MATTELKFVHVRPFTYGETGESVIGQRGGLTIVHTLPRNRGERMIYVSMSFCNKNDVFSRAKGRGLALNKFIRGESIQIAIDPSVNIGHQLKHIFTPLMNASIPYDNDMRYRNEQRMHKGRPATEVRKQRRLQIGKPAVHQSGQEGCKVPPEYESLHF